MDATTINAYLAARHATHDPTKTTYLPSHPGAPEYHAILVQNAAISQLILIHHFYTDPQNGPTKHTEAQLHYIVARDLDALLRGPTFALALAPAGVIP